MFLYLLHVDCRGLNADLGGIIFRRSMRKMRSGVMFMAQNQPIFISLWSSPTCVHTIYIGTSFRVVGFMNISCINPGTPLMKQKLFGILSYAPFSETFRTL